MSHSLSKLWTHLIFSTKNRYPYLENPNIKTTIKVASRENILNEFLFNCCFFVFIKIFVNDAVKNYVLDILAIKYSPDETAGPIPKAKITVPIPMVPPRDQPILMTVSSKKIRTQAIGRPVTL